MHLVNFGVTNYKSFRQLTTVSLKAGFNIVVGKNNVGKSAFIEGMSLVQVSNPFRGLVNLPTRNTPLQTPQSAFSCQVTFDYQELLSIFATETQYVPLPTHAGLEAAFESFAQSLQSAPKFEFAFLNGNCHTASFLANTYQSGTSGGYAISVTNDKLVLAGTGLFNVDRANQFPYSLAKVVSRRIYRFSAERLRLASSLAMAKGDLEPDASNLAQVLHHLSSSNPARFTRFNRLVSLVFPEIRQVTAQLDVANPAVSQIRIWTIDPETERDDLALTLDNCGTGVGQVLAMLYIIATSDDPKVLVIDEPNSFLHPGAVRTLLEIFRTSQPTHQYVLTTHSGSVISAIESPSIIHISQSNGESNAQLVERQDLDSMRQVFETLGARLADVFGIDTLLWVEGPTEEDCFPKILREFSEFPIGNLVVLYVPRTSDFDKKHAEKAVEIYSRLSASNALLPPNVSFIFDRENRSEQEVVDLEKRLLGKLRFLDRRMLENYFLEPEAIAAVISDELGTDADDTLTLSIEEVLSVARNDPQWIKHLSPQDCEGQNWIRKVDGANLIRHVFRKVTNSRLEYDKRRHGRKITQWLLKNKRDALQQVFQTIKKALGTALPH